MKTSVLYSNTLKETPNDSDIISHQLMIKAGLIKKLASGLYTWLPLGLKVLRKVEAIIRHELDEIGFSEILMPIVQPAKFWKETDRWDKYGPLLLKIKDRHHKDYCFGPTHEEIVTDVIRTTLATYKNLPINVYQIQTKFRDEIRPRYGVMRSREFVMKDAYSFNEDQDSLSKTYKQVFDAYHQIFSNLGLKVKSVLADNGSIGGESSHEFHVLAKAGEDDICFSNQSDYAANVELTEVLVKQETSNEKDLPLETIELSKNITALDELTSEFNQAKVLKSIIVKGVKDELVMLVLANKHSLNTVKAGKHPNIASPLTILSASAVEKQLNVKSIFVGPINASIPIVLDKSIVNLKNFVTGVNINGFISKNVNWEIDIKLPETFDLRNVVEGDPSPCGKGELKIKKGIEVGHIFQLGDSYTAPMNARYTDQSGKKSTPLMGCYGIGVSRIVAAAIEQSHDEKGIIWPESISPFQFILIPIDYQKSDECKKITDDIYTDLSSSYEVLLDDRKANPGAKFADADLIGITHRIVISPKLIKDSMVEYKHRTSSDVKLVPINELASFVANLYIDA